MKGRQRRLVRVVVCVGLAAALLGYLHLMKNQTIHSSNSSFPVNQRGMKPTISSTTTAADNTEREKSSIVNISLFDYRQSIVGVIADQLYRDRPIYDDRLCVTPSLNKRITAENMCSFRVQAPKVAFNSSTLRRVIELYQAFDNMYLFDNCKFNTDFHGTTKYFDCLPSTKSKFEIPADTTQYFTADGPSPVGCFSRGTERVLSGPDSPVCVCKSGYSGTHCSLPLVVKVSNLEATKVTPWPTKQTRKLIVVFPFNIEFEVLQLRLEATADVVDAFLILESNYTGFGEARPLFLERLLRRGFLWKYQHKIVRVLLDHYLDEARHNGWIIDSYLRNYISLSAMPRCISGLRDDDWIISYDADEVMSREAMLFLKTHTNIPLPISVNFGFYKYGFFWDYGKWIYMGINTVKLVRDCFSNHVHQGRRFSEKKFSKLAEKNNTCAELAPLIHKWTLGSDGMRGGWHCSHCGTPWRAQLKDHSVHVGESKHHEKFYKDTSLANFANRFRYGEYYANAKLKSSCPVRDRAVPTDVEFSITPNLFVNFAAIP